MLGWGLCTYSIGNEGQVKAVKLDILVAYQFPLTCAHLPTDSKDFSFIGITAVRS